MYYFGINSFPDGTYRVLVIGPGPSSNYFTVSNGVIVNNNVPRLSKPLPNPPQPTSITVSGLADIRNGLYVGDSVCNLFGYDLYNINNQLVAHVGTCGGNREIMGLYYPGTSTYYSIPDGSYYVYGYMYAGVQNNAISYNNVYSNIFYIVNGRFYSTPPPTVSQITAPTSPIQVNTPIVASATFTDLPVSDTHTAIWNWGDGTTSTGTITESNGSGSVSDNHIYTFAGVYEITLTVTDNNGAQGSSIYQYISVYNPTPQGLFTSARRFISPAGAYLQNPSLTGQVQFGITAKYQGITPFGNVSMNFNAADLNFEATSITVLVTEGDKATLRGTGTINGSGNYNFLVTGLDGNQGGDDFLRFQIKDPANNNAVIYDSQQNAADTTDPTTYVIGQLIVH